MPYRKLTHSLTWHWCHNCSCWPHRDFRQREDKPVTWNGQTLCEECAMRDGCSDCQHSITLSVGLPSDSWVRMPLPHREPRGRELDSWEGEGGRTAALPQAHSLFSADRGQR